MKRLYALFWIFLICIAGWFATGLKNDNSIESFFIKDTAEYAQFQDFTREFGADEMVIFGLCGDLIREEVRHRVSSLSSSLEKIPHAEKVVSPLDFLTNPFDAEGASEKARTAGFLSADGNAFALFVIFKPEVKSHRAAIHTSVLEIKKLWEGKFDCMHIAGPPLLNTSLNRSGQEVGQKFFPLLLLFTVVLLILLFRDPVFVLAPLITVVCAEILTLGLIAAAGVPFGLVLTLIPTIVFIFSLSSSIHVLNHFHFQLSGTKGELTSRKVESLLSETYKEKTAPLVYSLLTTALGFLSLGFSSVEPIRNMGIFAALACTLVGVSTLGPLRFFLIKGVTLWGHNSPFLLKGVDRLCIRVFTILLPYRGLLLCICLGLVGSGAYLLKNLPVETNALNYFKESDPLKKDIQWVEKNLTGVSTINLLLKIDTDETAREKFLIAIRKFPDVRNVLSRELFPGIPPIKFESEHYERILLQTATKGRETLKRVRQGIEDLSQRVGAGKVLITGQYPLILDSQGKMIQTLTTSLFAASIVIGVILVGIAGNIPLALAAAIPNMTTVFLVFVFMGIFNIAVDVTTVTVAAVALGIAVDDTIHIMMFYRKNREQGISYKKAIEKTLQVVGIPVSVTSLIIGSGFAILTLSDFLPIHNFGFLMSLTVFSAYILDVVVTPVVLGFPMIHRPDWGREW